MTQRKSTPWHRGHTALAALAVAGFTALAAHAEPPAEPSIATMDQLGKRGGELHMLVGRAKDVRLMVVYGYARLVAYNRQFDIVPDILKDIEVEEGRIFTLHLRRGHKWSDGHPFTAEDFRYWWEDVANNEMLSPVGPPAVMLVEGEPPVFEVIDELTVRYTWPAPNPHLLPALAGATPLFIYMPAHYLKQFHVAHQDEAKLAEMVTADEARDWAQLHGRRDGLYNFDNPDLPTLQPWQITNRAPAERFIGERNEYFHRVDENGVQLPYIDRVVLEVVDNKLVPIKTGAGETDLQSRGLFFKDYTFLKDSEERSGLQTYLWREARGAHLALYPNLNAIDEGWRELFRDVRFRRALSLAVDRNTINQYLYFGLGYPANNTILPESPLYSPEVADAWTEFDIEKANALLDEIGLTERDGGGLRLMPDGRPMELVVETAGEDTEQSDLLELLRDTWLQIDLKIHTKPSQREVFRNRIFSGEALMTIWYGLENGVPTADMSPHEFAPTEQQKGQWPMWGQHHETKGEAGTPPDMPEAQKLMELFHAWGKASSTEERRAIWDEMLAIYADQVFTIGTVGQVLQPVAVRENLRNVPEDAIYNWDPGAQFGVYRPDTFWFDGDG